MGEAYRDDLSDFIRHGKLDAYELTDEELARLLEVWRWSVWTRHTQPSPIDHDISAAACHLQARLACERNVEVEYNTALLLKAELEPLMMLRALSCFPRALAYFLHPKRWLALLRGMVRARRYSRLRPAQDAYGNPLGYPTAHMEGACGRAPDLLKRRYWRQISPYSFSDRKTLNYWW
jgi:hypothetical protein